MNQEQPTPTAPSPKKEQSDSILTYKPRRKKPAEYTFCYMIFQYISTEAAPFHHNEDSWCVCVWESLFLNIYLNICFYKLTVL